MAASSATRLSKKSARDNYIYFRKIITDKNKIVVINALAKEWVLTNEEVCQRLLCDAIAKERNRLKL